MRQYISPRIEVLTIQPSTSILSTSDGNNMYIDIDNNNNGAPQSDAW